MLLENFFVPLTIANHDNKQAQDEITSTRCINFDEKINIHRLEKNLNMLLLQNLDL